MRLSGQKAEARAAAEPLVAAIDAHAKEAGTCPDTLESLVPRHLVALPARRVTYRCLGSEKRYLLAYEDRSGLFLPSDLVHQFDSRTRAWSLLDGSEAEAFDAPAAK